MLDRRIAITALGVFVLAMAGSARTAQATVVNYPDFSNVGGLTLVGSANNTDVPGQLELTPAANGQSGAAYSTTPILLGAGDSFSTQFQFQFTNQGGINPADGITFVLAANPNGLGQAGSGLGYSGVPNSVALAFDTFNNGLNDGNSSNHTYVSIDGNVANGSPLANQAQQNVYGNAECDFDVGYTQPGCLSNGDVWTVTITYDGNVLNEVISDPAENASFDAINSYAIDIASYLGTNTAFVGFTGSTGGGYAQQNVLNWEFANTAELPVPEPGTLVLFATAGATLVMLRRRPG